MLSLTSYCCCCRCYCQVCHGSKLWSGQLEKAYNIRLVNYFDTQQAHHVYNVSTTQKGLRLRLLHPGFVVSGFQLQKACNIRLVNTI